MTLTLRDPKAIEMAKELASLRGVSEADAIAQALEGELRRQQEIAACKARLVALGERVRAQAGPNGREMSKDEIDAMWGH